MTCRVVLILGVLVSMFPFYWIVVLTTKATQNIFMSQVLVPGRNAPFALLFNTMMFLLQPGFGGSRKALVVATAPHFRCGAR